MKFVPLNLALILALIGAASAVLIAPAPYTSSVISTYAAAPIAYSAPLYGGVVASPAIGYSAPYTTAFAYDLWKKKAA